MWGIGLFLFVVGIVAALLAFDRAEWRLGIASAGILVLAAVHVCAAIRRRPL
jgi:hypothetical protein